MRKLKLYIATSLDGKIARKDGSIDWLPDPSTGDYGYPEFMKTVDTIIMGSKTYDVCVSFGEWPYPDKDTYVFSRSRDKKGINDVELVHQEPREFVLDLKKTKGSDIWLMGGGEIITLLHDAGLIDEYILAYIPVILGEGIELFPGIHQQVNLSLYHHQVYPDGVIMMYFSNTNNKNSV